MLPTLPPTDELLTNLTETTMEPPEKVPDQENVEEVDENTAKLEHIMSATEVCEASSRRRPNAISTQAPAALCKSYLEAANWNLEVVAECRKHLSRVGLVPGG